ncbi:hypothetical protein, partial [Pseudomonas viridiflava]|uniref:hypothetical protein n=1 Tax=Pseudomonas viridiflava TaxID=33069 RepID=UPI0013DE9E78
QSYARFLELIENTTDSELLVTLQLHSSLGSGEGTKIINSSSGDQMFDITDRYLLTDDEQDNAQAPAMGHLFDGANAGSGPNEAWLNSSEYGVRYNLTLPPHSRKVLMHYAVQNDS